MTTTVTNSTIRNPKLTLIRYLKLNVTLGFARFIHNGSKYLIHGVFDGNSTDNIKEEE